MGCGVGDTTSPISLLCICLVSIMLTCLVTPVTVLMVRVLISTFNREDSSVVCTTCSGLLEKELVGVFGACSCPIVRLSRLLKGLMNRYRGRCMVTVPIAKLSWFKLESRLVLHLIRGP